MGHSYGTLLSDTLARHTCETLLWDTHAGHSYGTLLWDTLVGRSCGALLWDTLAGHPCRKLLWDTLVGHSCRALFVRDFLQKSRVKSPERAFSTRLPPKVTCQVSKTSVSYETSSKIPMSKSAKRAYRTRLPPKVKQKHPSEHTHTSRSPAKQFRESSPSKQHPFTRQSHCDSDIHLYHNSRPHNSLRLPRIFPHPHV